MNLIKIKYIIPLIILLVVLSANCFAGSSEKGTEKEILYPQTTEVNINSYEQVIFVSSSEDSVNGSGIKSSPFHSITKAIAAVEKENTAVLVAEGNYTEETIKLIEGVSLFGGYDSVSWNRDIINNRTILSGSKKSRVLIAADETTIDGFIISDGIIRGKGGGIYFNSGSPTITNNIFIDNKTLGPENWNPEYWHETANDGGAIYFEDGASPIISGNLFMNNKTENGRGAAIACNNKAEPVIKDNVFLNNHTGLNDPMRSSDGGAVSVFDWCDAAIRGNIFLSNLADSRNDGGALFVALWSSAEIENNMFIDSESGDDAGALFVGGQEHRYDEPLDPIPPKDDFFVNIENNLFIGNKNGSKNSGAMRFTMESRGRFANNITALNNGIYFQRSEVAVENNIILDNFLFIETKEGLEPGSITHNIIWADFDLRIGAEVKNNNIRDLYADSTKYHKESLNHSDQPKFKDDRIIINAYSTNWEKLKHFSKIYDPTKKFKPNELVDRVVKSGDRYSVVISNTESTIKIWGDFSGENNFIILPTYTLLNK